MDLSDGARSSRKPRNFASFMSFAPLSAGCFVMSSILPPSRARAAMKSACSSTADGRCPRVEAALARIPGGLTLGVKIGADPSQSRPAAISWRWRASPLVRPAGGPRRRSRPRLEGRPLRAPQRNRRPRRRAARLYAARRQLQLSTAEPSRTGLYMIARARPGAADRRLPVRKRLYRGTLRRAGRRHATESAASSPTASAPPSSRRRRPTQTPPTFSTSANCAPPKASTRCSRRSPGSGAPAD